MALAAALSPSPCHAYLQTYDGFNYPTGTPGTIDGFTGGTGWSTYWGQFFGATGEIVTNGSLADPTASLYTFSNHVYSAGSFAGRFFVRPNLWAYPGTTNYFSILIRPENTPATNHYYGLQIFSDGNNTGNNADLFVGKAGSGLNWGLEYSTNNIVGDTTNAVFVDSYSSKPAVSNQTALLVVRVIFAAGEPDSFALYVNPTPGNPEPATPDATILDDIGTQDGIGLNSGGGGLVSYDEIRIGATFTSVTPTTSTPDSNLEAWEPFAYNSFQGPVTLDGQNGGAGWDYVSWGQGLGGATAYTNTVGTLVDPSGELLTSGGRETTAALSNSYSYAGRYPHLTNYNGTAYGTPGTTNYYSVLIQPESTVTPSNYWGLGLFASGSNAGVFVGKPGDSLFYGLEYSTNTIVGTTTNTVYVDSFSTTQAASNQTAFLVTRVYFLPNGTEDEFRLYVNPTPGGPEPTTPSAVLTNFIGNQNGVGFECGDNGSGETQVSFDEVRIGTTFADATPRAMHIQSIARSTNDMLLTWSAAVGTTNLVQATSGSNGSYNTNGFATIGTIIIPGTTGPIVTNPPAIGSAVTTNYLDSLGATNKARYYRVEQLGP